MTLGGVLTFVDFLHDQYERIGLDAQPAASSENDSSPMRHFVVKNTSAWFDVTDVHLQCVANNIVYENAIGQKVGGGVVTTNSDFVFAEIEAGAKAYPVVPG